ncbi:MAG: hypothetical protein AMJ65_18560 [Phycisphaerae bacterium SG8_4]|nr:MAG: hypothetical protein AMJ65_18560 [Phycisphaerae bacterium SG8_4]
MQTELFEIVEILEFGGPELVALTEVRCKRRVQLSEAGALTEDIWEQSLQPLILWRNGESIVLSLSPTHRFRFQISQ